MRKTLVLSSMMVAILPLTAPSSRAAETHIKKRVLPQSAQARQQRQAVQREQREIMRRHQQRMAAVNRLQRQPRTVLLEGKILTPDGKPAANAKVHVTWRGFDNRVHSQALTTNTGGVLHQKLHMPNGAPSGSIEVFALLPGQGVAWKTVALNTSAPGSLDMKLQPGVTLTGRLLQPDGAPAAKKSLRAAWFQPGGDQIRNVINMNGAMMQNAFSPNQRFMALGGASASYQATTGEDGRFTLTNVPPDCDMGFNLQGDQVLTQGSLASFHVLKQGTQDVGVLVAAAAARLKITVRDVRSGKPAAKVPISISLMENTPFNNFDMQQNGVTPKIFQNPSTDASGQVTAKGLIPGEYAIFVNNRLLRVKAVAGQETPLQNRMRRGSLHGKVVDADGKPMAGLKILMNAGADTDIPAFNFSNNRFGWEKQPVATTSASGEFEVPQMQWGSAWITLRADRNNDRAEWTGAPAKLGDSLVLRMKKNALITVTGRLIDPQRRPLTKAAFQSLHWLPTPRFFWLSNARVAKADSTGRFRVTGLERGESFSFITGSRQFGIQQASVNQKPFESPRFATLRSGQEQDLGDVMIHPSQDPQEIDQNYGFEGDDGSAGVVGLLPVPSAKAIAEAKQVWQQYRQRLTAGDVEGVQSLVSRVTPGWSEDRPQFLSHTSLQNISLRAEDSPDALFAIRYVPATVAASLVRLGTQRSVINQADKGAIAREMASHPQWVFLSEKQNNALRTVAALRKEEGVWRVVALPEAFLKTADAMPFNNGAATEVESKDLTVPGSVLEAEEEKTALRVAGEFLRQWSLDRPAFMHTLTAPNASFYAAKPADYQKLLSGRTDAGHCPLQAGEEAELQQVRDLSQWEQQWLGVQSSGSMSFRSQRQMSQILSSRSVSFDGQFPRDYVKRGDLAFFRYRAEGQTFLMVLARSQKKWQVLEPALPLAEPSANHDLAVR